MNIYEQYGRLSEQFVQAVEAKELAVGVIVALKKGERSLDDIEVTDKGITLKERKS